MIFTNCDKGHRRMKAIYKKSHKLIDELVELNISARMLHRLKGYNHKEIGLSSYLVDCCTVRVNLGRLIGHTEYIIRRADENSVVLVFNEICVRNIIRKTNGKHSFDMFTIDTMYKKQNKTYKKIYIDGFATWLVENKQNIHNDIYRLFGKSPSQTFIFIG